ncbi:hypothetical protein ET475_05120 [Microbacterium protaetiae]|uniref:MarR family transcriptional regulator n=1 Tax=Microbacterium protaetiae TaxID=2509458 RepID=A0A4P6EBS9_9MICO|nr:hypothetical protein [Microbacterium protaetiae]QAY59434.1 hypothetical protein ET475_05120 [Microbacterium protaetiae]
MNTTPEQGASTPEEGSTPTDPRPLGAWLRLVDRLIAREFASALEGADLTRRDWMLLNAAAGTVEAPWMADRLTPGGKRVARLARRGWIAREGDTWKVTDEGRSALDRLTEKVEAVRAKVTGTLSDDEFAQLKGSLESIARGLGWDESQPLPPRRGRRGARRGARPNGDERGAGWGPYGRGHGFGGYGREFGERRRGHDPRGAYQRGWNARERRIGEAGGDFDARAEFEHGFGPGRRGFGPGHHAYLREEFERRHHGRGMRNPRSAEGAYERGFAAGFTAANARPAASTPPVD